MSGLNSAIRENVKLYLQNKEQNPNAEEDVCANLALLADLCHDPASIQEIDTFKESLPSLTYQEIVLKIRNLQNALLQKFVGVGKDLNEDNLRLAIYDRFNISFLQKPSKK